MKILPCLTILAALTTSAIAAPQTVFVHAQIVELTTNDSKPPKDLSRLAERKGVDVLTSPILKTPSGKPTKLSIMREFVVPRKGTFEVGVVLTVRPTLVSDRKIQYLVDFEMTEFQGFAARSASKAPMFSTTKTIGIDGTTPLGKPVVLDLGTRQDEQTVQEPGKPSRTATIYRRIFAILKFSKTPE